MKAQIRQRRDHAACEQRIPGAYCLDQWAAQVAALHQLCQPCAAFIVAEIDFATNGSLPWSAEVLAAAGVDAPQEIEPTVPVSPEEIAARSASVEYARAHYEALAEQARREAELLTEDVLAGEVDQ